MDTKAVLASVLLCSIIQISVIQSTLGSGVALSVLVKIVLQNTNSTTTLDPEECNNGVGNLQLYAPAPDGLSAKWDPLVSSCQNVTGYEVTLSQVGGTFRMSNTTEKTYIIYPGLVSSTAYQVTVQPLSSSGLAFGNAVTAEKTTPTGPSNSPCRFPALHVITLDDGIIGCGMAEIVKENRMDPCTTLMSWQNSGEAELYTMVHNISEPIEDMMAHLKLLGYTDDLLVLAEFSDGKWRWGDDEPVETSYPLPAGGSKPGDYNILYLDASNDFALNATVIDMFSGIGSCLCIYALPPQAK